MNKTLQYLNLRCDVENFFEPHHGVVVLVQDGDRFPAVLSDQVDESFACLKEKKYEFDISAYYLTSFISIGDYRLSLRSEKIELSDYLTPLTPTSLTMYSVFSNHFHFAFFISIFRFRVRFNFHFFIFPIFPITDGVDVRVQGDGVVEPFRNCDLVPGHDRSLRFVVPPTFWKVFKIKKKIIFILALKGISIFGTHDF